MNILQKERALFLSSQGKKKKLFLHIINHLLVKEDKTEPVSTSWQSRAWLLCFKLCWNLKHTYDVNSKIILNKGSRLPL